MAVHTLPQPNSTFTIPSLHDDLELDCRLYYPCRRRSHDRQDSQQTDSFSGRTYAIIGHPYASLGGSYDDGVVASIASLMLRKGITVGLFNFRGAGESAGRTSWTGKAELVDYVSFYGFMVCLIEAVERRMHEDSHGHGDGVVSEQIPAPEKPHEQRKEPVLILGGYSYGSLITSCLPDHALVSGLFHNAEVDVDLTEIEIRGRADKAGRDLAAYFSVSEQEVLGRGRASLRIPPTNASPMKRSIAMGGYESSEAEAAAVSSRASRESSRVSLSFEGGSERMRRSMDRTRHKIRTHINSSSVDSDPSSAVTGTTSTPISPDVPAVVVSPINNKVGGGVSTFKIPHLEIAYLVVSPLLGQVSMFTTMFSKPIFEMRDGRTGKVSTKDASSDRDDKFTRAKRKTCFIWGTKDVFTPSKKVTKWVDGLKKKSDEAARGGETGRVTSHEIQGAGHFWVEEGAMKGLLDGVKAWLDEL